MFPCSLLKITFIPKILSRSVVPQGKKSPQKLNQTTNIGCKYLDGLFCLNSRRYILESCKCPGRLRHPTSSHLAPAIIILSASFNAPLPIFSSVGCYSLSDAHSDHFFIFLITKKNKNKNLKMIFIYLFWRGRSDESLIMLGFEM